MSSLQGKVALITGAGRGIGRAVALALAQSGCRVVLAARSENQLKDVLKEVRSGDGDGLGLPTDLTRDQEISRLVDESLKAYQRVDILINNAGWGKRSPVTRADIEDWDRTFGVNLRAPMILAKLLLPQMMERGEGAIINIGSISGKSGDANAAAYAASKFGLIGFTQSLYEEVRELGIKVTVILPGFVNTPMIPPVKHLDRSKMIQPEDVAHAVMFVVNSPKTCCPVELTLRPQETPYR